MKAKKQQDTAIAVEAVISDTETAAEQAADTFGTERIAAGQAALFNAETAAESATEELPRVDLAEEAACKTEPMNLSDICRAQLAATAARNAQLVSEYGVGLTQSVPSAAKGIEELLALHQAQVRQRIAGWR